MATREISIETPPAARGDGSGVNISEAERWASTLGGGALTAVGLSRRDWRGMALAALGGAMMVRGVTGHCPVNAATGRNTAESPRYSLKVESTYTINASPDRLYSFWRNLENLPRFMSHLESVQDLGNGRSRWVAHGPAGARVEWEAEIIRDVKNESIAWQSVEGSQIDNAGAVRFVAAPGGRGTEMRVTLAYNPPLGAPGAIIAKIFGAEPEGMIDDDLRRFKTFVEAGEVPTTQGQPTGKSPHGQESLAHALLHSSR